MCRTCLVASARDVTGMKEGAVIGRGGMCSSFCPTIAGSLLGRRRETAVGYGFQAAFVIIELITDATIITKSVTRYRSVRRWLRLELG